MVAAAAIRKDDEPSDLGGGADEIRPQPDGSRAIVATGENVTAIEFKTPTATGQIDTGRGSDGIGLEQFRAQTPAAARLDAHKLNRGTKNGRLPDLFRILRSLGR